MSSPQLASETLDEPSASRQLGCVIWLTGLSGAGKSTVAAALTEHLRQLGSTVCGLDGDVVREGLCSDLGFSPQDRHENIRRIAEVASLVANAGVVAIVACISPYRSDRELARRRAPSGRFVEIAVTTPSTVCEARDPKGLWARARAGELPEFTGVSAPYEHAIEAELTIDTSSESTETSVSRIVTWLGSRSVLPISEKLR